MEENGSRLVLEAKGITKVFPGTTALQDVDFKIYSGRINALASNAWPPYSCTKERRS